jgi:DNA-binding response OmpR family regulator
MRLDDIIIVDDNPAIREALAEYLLDTGYTVRTAGDGPALDLLLQARPADALILDVNLPDENGYAIASRVREALPWIGILILSAQLKSAPSQTHASIADLQLAKPLEPQVLVQALGEVCALARARRL